MRLGDTITNVRTEIVRQIGSYADLDFEDFHSSIYKVGNKLLYFEFNGDTFDLEGIFVDGLYSFHEGCTYLSATDYTTIKELIDAAKLITIT